MKPVNGARRRLGGVLVLLAASALAAIAAHAADEPRGRIERIDLKTETAATKVIIMLSRPLAFHVRVLDGEAARKSVKRLVLDFEDATLAPDASAPIEVGDGLVQQVRSGRPEPGKARIVLDLAKDVTHTVEAYETPPHVTVAIGEAAGALDGAAVSPSPAAGGATAPALLAPREPWQAR